MRRTGRAESGLQSWDAPSGGGPGVPPAAAPQSTFTGPIFISIYLFLFYLLVVLIDRPEDSERPQDAAAAAAARVAELKGSFEISPSEGSLCLCQRHCCGVTRLHTSPFHSHVLVYGETPPTRQRSHFSFLREQKLPAASNAVQPKFPSEFLHFTHFLLF